MTDNMGQNSNIMSNNITKVIKNIKKINILNQLGCDEKYIVDNASDFEWFDLWECASLLCAGHGELDVYYSELRKRGLEPTVYSEICRESSIARWIAANGGDSMARKNVAVTQEKRSREYLEKALAISKADKDTTIVCLEDRVSKFTSVCQSISELSERISNEIIALEKSCITLSVELCAEEYERPDPYGAGRLFLKKISGEKLNNKEQNIFISQLLIEIIIRSKKEKNIRLLIKEGGKFGWSASLVEYLERRRLFTGEIWVDIASDTVPSLLYKRYTGIKASPLLDLDRLSPSEEQLVAAFREYPVGGFIFKGGKGSRELISAIESVAQSADHAKFILDITCI